MENGVEMGESFSMWGFSIPNPLNLLENEIRNKDKKFY